MDKEILLVCNMVLYCYVYLFHKDKNSQFSHVTDWVTLCILSNLPKPWFLV